MAIRRKHIDRIYSRKFSLLDHRKLGEYFENQELNKQTRTVLQEQWNEFRPDQEAAPDLDPVYQKVRGGIYKPEKIATKIRNLFQEYLGIAAAVLAGFIISTAIYAYHSRPGHTFDNRQVSFISHTGFRNQFTLPDGTTGWLGYGSELTYQVDARHRRIVSLNGMAFFEVTSARGRPFIVKTPAELNVEVLGTKFNVSSYAADRECEVILQEGRVRLTMHGHPAGELFPNERVVYDSKSNSFEKSQVEASGYLAWKDGKLFLDDVSLREACVKLGHFYNVEFELLRPEINKKKIRLVLEDESLEGALNLLSMIASVQCHLEDRKVMNDNRYSKKKVIIR